MFNVKKLLSLLLITPMCIGALAQTKMILHQKAGGDVAILLADKPVATYEGDNLVITTTKTTLSFPVSNIKEATYQEDNAATAIIESVTQLSPDAGPSRIYDISGRLVKTVPATESLNLGSLPQGTYIIKNNNTSYKINKK